MAIRFALSAAQAQVWHTLGTWFISGAAMYVYDALVHRAAGGPAFALGSLIVGAVIAGLVKGLGAWIATAPRPGG